MLGYYLWLIPCFQFVLISVAGDKSEHIHIKVHVPETNRKHAPHNRIRHPQPHREPQPIPGPYQYFGRGPIRTTKVTHHSSSPYEFDFYGLTEAAGNFNDNNKIPKMAEDLMGGINNAGPVLFNNGYTTTTVNTQQPMMSKQAMRQLFTPEMLSVLEDQKDASHELDDVNSQRNGLNDFLSEYLQHLNQQHTPRSQKYSTKTTHKRKKYGNIGIGEDYLKETGQAQPYFGSSLLQYQRPQHPETEQQLQQQKRHTLESISLPRNQRHQSNNNLLHYGFEDNSDAFDATEDVSSSGQDSNEDMTTAFNGLQPISYQDMFGAYATPLTTTSHQQNLNYQQTTDPTYRTNWHQFYPQQPHQQSQQQQQYQLHQQQQQQSEFLHQRQKQQSSRYKQQKQEQEKSQQIQYVLPSTTLRLTTSSSSSLSPSTPSLVTTPIRSDFTGGSFPSRDFVPWTSPHKYVQQSQQQQQQQQQHQQQQTYLKGEQYQHRQHKLVNRKKRKNRNKHKRIRINVE